MLHMEQRHQDIIQKILAKYPYDFYAFGSRIKGKARKLSDLDLCLIDDVPLSVQSHLEEDFEESDLPFAVDVLSWNMLDTEFQNHIKNDLVCIYKGAYH